MARSEPVRISTGHLEIARKFSREATGRRLPNREAVEFALQAISEEAIGRTADHVAALVLEQTARLTAYCLRHLAADVLDVEEGAAGQLRVRRRDLAAAGPAPVMEFGSARIGEILDQVEATLEAAAAE